MNPADYIPPPTIRPREQAGPWLDRAVCRGIDPDLFFPQRGEPTDPAKAVCAGCPVAAECLEYALVNGERFGVWGGLSERERRAIRYARNRAARAAEGKAA
jgi:WhiB family transcriptional regulator, redox-sensing transcriptional regulator